MIYTWQRIYRRDEIKPDLKETSKIELAHTVAKTLEKIVAVYEQPLPGGEIKHFAPFVLMPYGQWSQIKIQLFEVKKQLKNNQVIHQMISQIIESIETL